MIHMMALHKKMRAIGTHALKKEHEIGYIKMSYYKAM